MTECENCGWDQDVVITRCGLTLCGNCSWEHRDCNACREEMRFEYGDYLRKRAREG